MQQGVQYLELMRTGVIESKVAVATGTPCTLYNTDENTTVSTTHNGDTITTTVKTLVCDGYAAVSTDGRSIMVRSFMSQFPGTSKSFSELQRYSALLHFKKQFAEYEILVCEVLAHSAYRDCGLNFISSAMCATTKSKQCQHLHRFLCFFKNNFPSYATDHVTHLLRSIDVPKTHHEIFQELFFTNRTFTRFVGYCVQPQQSLYRLPYRDTTEYNMREWCLLRESVHWRGISVFSLGDVFLLYKVAGDVQGEVRVFYEKFTVMRCSTFIQTPDPVDNLWKAQARRDCSALLSDNFALDGTPYNVLRLLNEGHEQVHETGYFDVASVKNVDTAYCYGRYNTEAEWQRDFYNLDTNQTVRKLSVITRYVALIEPLLCRPHEREFHFRLHCRKFTFNDVQLVKPELPLELSSLPNYNFARYSRHEFEVASADDFNTLRTHKDSMCRLLQFLDPKTADVYRLPFVETLFSATHVRSLSDEPDKIQQVLMYNNTLRQKMVVYETPVKQGVLRAYFRFVV